MTETEILAEIFPAGDVPANRTEHTEFVTEGDNREWDGEWATEIEGAAPGPLAVGDTLVGDHYGNPAYHGDLVRWVVTDAAPSDYATFGNTDCAFVARRVGDVPAEEMGDGPGR